jgi:putative ABC transport system substrate-binding protein
MPIVFSTGADPIQEGLVASLNRPGGNVTGATNISVELTPKRLGLLHELLPRAARFAVLVNPNDPNAASGGLVSHRAAIIVAAARNNVPAVYSVSEFVRDGGLLSYGVDLVDTYRGAANYVDRILRGAKPGDLPVQFPVKYEMAVNLKTAKALGLTVPLTLQAIADEVIE